MAPAAAPLAAGVSSRRRIPRHTIAGILLAAGDRLVSQTEIMKALRLPKDHPHAQQSVQMAVCRLREKDGYAIERVIAYRLKAVP